MENKAAAREEKTHARPRSRGNGAAAPSLSRNDDSSHSAGTVISAGKIRAAVIIENACIRTYRTP